MGLRAEVHVGASFAEHHKDLHVYPANSVSMRQLLQRSFKWQVVTKGKELCTGKA